MKRSVLFAGMTLAVAGLATPAAADCGEVTITEMDWASSAVVTEVSKFLLEQGLGCSVTTVPSSTVPSVTSVAETGQPDIVTELWINSAAIYPKLKEEGKVVPLANVLSDGGAEGWWVPTYLAEKHPELTTIEGVLANPELVGGRFHNCPDGWGCRITNDNLIRAVDMEDSGMEVFNHGSGETLATSIAAAFEDEAPWFGYYWAPTSVLGRFPMTEVKIGDYNKEAHECNVAPNCPDPKASDYPAAPVLTIATTDFESREPAAAELMSNVAFTNDMMSSLLAWQEENNASPEEVAVHFLTTNSDIWSTWLNDEAKEKLSGLIQ